MASIVRMGDWQGCARFRLRSRCDAGPGKGRSHREVSGWPGGDADGTTLLEMARFVFLVAGVIVAFPSQLPAFRRER